MEKSKMHLIAAARDFMQEVPLEKITITDICDRAELSRQAFYHHYRDKYDLINSIFLYLFSDTFLKINQGSPWFDNIERFLSELQKEKKFYMNAYHYQGQNSLEAFHYQLVYDFYLDFFEQRKGRKIDPDEDFFLELYCRGAVFMVAEWARGGMLMSPRKLTYLFQEAMPDHIKKYLIV